MLLLPYKSCLPTKWHLDPRSKIRCHTLRLLFHPSLTLSSEKRCNSCSRQVSKHQVVVFDIIKTINEALPGEFFESCITWFGVKNNTLRFITAKATQNESLSTKFLPKILTKVPPFSEPSLKYTINDKLVIKGKSNSTYYIPHHLTILLMLQSSMNLRKVIYNTLYC